MRDLSSLLASRGLAHLQPTLDEEALTLPLLRMISDLSSALAELGISEADAAALQHAVHGPAAAASASTGTASLAPPAGGGGLPPAGSLRHLRVAVVGHSGYFAGDSYGGATRASLALIREALRLCGGGSVDVLALTPKPLPEGLVYALGVAAGAAGGGGGGGGGDGGGGGGGGGGGATAGAAAAGGGAGGGGGNAASLQDSRGAPVAVAVGAAFALYSLLFLWLANLPASSAFYLQVQRRFWTQPLLLVAAWFGLGVATLTSRLAPRRPAAAAALSLLLVAAHASHPFAGGGRVADCADVPLFDAFGGEVLRALPDKRRVLLLTVGDEVVNSVRYLHRALAVRQRLTILDLNYAQFRWFVRRAARAGAGFDGVSWPGDAYGSSPGSFLMEQLLDANYDAFEVYVCGGMHPRDESWRRGYQLWPVGLVSQVVRRGTPFDAQEWAARSARALPRLAFARPPQPGSWAEVVARNHYVPAYALRPFALLEAAYAAKGHAAAERALFNAAARLYDETVAVELNGSLRMPEYVWRNLGVAHSQLLRIEPGAAARAAARRRAASAFLRYLAHDTVDAADRETVEQAVLSLADT